MRRLDLTLIICCSFRNKDGRSPHTIQDLKSYDNLGKFPIAKEEAHKGKDDMS
jgi:hypothetical protein